MEAEVVAMNFRTQIWMKMFRETLEYVQRNTDIAGKLQHGMNWPSMDWVSMLLFNVIILKMSLSVKTNMESYFKEHQEMTRKKFTTFYSSLKMYNIDDANESGVNNKSNAEKYDSLWKCRDVWNKTIVNLQKMRNPPQQLSLDKSMAKYKVKITVMQRSQLST